MLEGINYLHGKFQINILKTEKLLNFLKSGNFGLKEKRKENSKCNRVVISTLKRKEW